MQAVAQVLEGFRLGNDVLGGPQARRFLGHVLAQFGAVGQQDAQVEQRRHGRAARVGQIGQRLGQPDNHVGLAQPRRALQQDGMRLLPVPVQQSLADDLVGLFRVQRGQGECQRRPDVRLVDLGFALLGIEFADALHGLEQHGPLRRARTQNFGAGGGTAGPVLVEEVNLPVHAVGGCEERGQMLGQGHGSRLLPHFRRAQEGVGHLARQCLHQRLGVVRLDGLVDLRQQPFDVR